MSSLVHSTLLRAHRYAKNGDFDGAEVCYKSILSKFPKNKRTIKAYRDFKLGGNSKTPSGSEPPQQNVQELVKLYNRGQFETVLSKLEPLIRLFPKTLILLSLQADCQMALKRYDSAIDTYNKFLTIKPYHADTYNWLGLANQFKGEWDDAVHNYESAIRINVNHYKAHFNMGNILHIRGDLNAAVKSYQKATTIKPDYYQAYNNMGTVFAETGNSTAAVDAYQKALEIKPESFTTCRNIVKQPTGLLKETTLKIVQDSIAKLNLEKNDSAGFRFMEADFLRHKKNTDRAFEKLIEANNIKTKDIEQNLEFEQNFHRELLLGLKKWSPHKTQNSVETVKIIFILGPSKSGKSSLEKTLSRSKVVHPLYERLKPDISVLIDKNILGKTSDSVNLLNSIRLSDLFYCDETLLKSNSIKIVTCSNPLIINGIAHIADTLPNSYFLFMSCNPLDVASSIFAAEYTSSNYYAYGAHSLMQYIDWYNASWDTVRKKIPDRTMTIDFECLLKKPQKIVDQLDAFLTTDIGLVDNIERDEGRGSQREFRKYFQNLVNLNISEVA